ncbi:MAG: DUF4199 domain-containing protein [Pseudomonadota bacterium]|nr:DUF4199 domain-containing protein [Pseudomonadota bacterium]
MTRIILVYGSIAGLIVGILMVIGWIAMSGEHGAGSMAVGYLTMLLALSFVFIAIKRHRDVNLGGVIRFWPALGIGLGVAALAGLFYVVSWEIYFNATGGAFMDAYIDAQIATRQADGATETELAAFEAEMRSFMTLYANWWFRMPMTFTEILPVGVLVSFVSAAVLRNPRVLPHRA